jgi:hypothetical protein
MPLLCRACLSEYGARDFRELRVGQLKTVGNRGRFLSDRVSHAEPHFCQPVYGSGLLTAMPRARRVCGFALARPMLVRAADFLLQQR